MSNAWQQAEELAEKHANQGGIFIRLANDGDKVVGAFCGEPRGREVFWDGEKYQDHDPDNPSHAGKPVSPRVMLNFYVPAEGRMKVIEGGNRWFRDVLKVREKYGLDNWMFEIERHGAAGDTKTRYSILPETQLDASLRAQIAAAPLHDLRSLANDEQDDASDAGAPISIEDANSIAARLKQLPRSGLDAFLAKFGIQRIRDLTTGDLRAAQELLSRLEAQHRPAAQESVDPFA
jgi:hypothetical protein